MLGLHCSAYELSIVIVCPYVKSLTNQNHVVRHMIKLLFLLQIKLYMLFATTFNCFPAKPKQTN